MAKAHVVITDSMLENLHIIRTIVALHVNQEQNSVHKKQYQNDLNLLDATLATIHDCTVR